METIFITGTILIATLFFLSQSLARGIGDTGGALRQIGLFILKKNPPGLVDIFDAYEKVHKGFVDKKHLDIRMNALKFGTMKTDKARSAWDFWKTTRDQEFIDWFESEIYGEDGFYIDEDQSEVRRKEFNTYRD